MRKVIVSTFVSLDGVMQAPGGPEEDASGSFTLGGWVFPYFDKTVDAAVGAVFDRRYDLLLGRRTYDIFAAVWPGVTEGPNAELAGQVNAATKYVATSSRDPLPWPTSVALHDPASDIAKLKEGEGPDLIVQGSSVLLQTLFVHGLVDELTTMVFPVVLGKGKRLFSEGVAPAAMRAVNSKASASGVVISTYAPAGAVQTGSFA